MLSINRLSTCGKTGLIDISKKLVPALVYKEYVRFRRKCVGFLRDFLLYCAMML